ncbi:MAG: translocation/assembly module TamB domain-containing protein [Gemmobacter sp.]
MRLDGTGRDLGIGSAEADRLLRGTTNLSLAAARQSGIVRVERIELGNPQIDLRGTGQVADDASRLDLTAQLADLALLVPGITGPVVVQGQVAEVTSGYGLTLSARGPGGIDARASGTVAADFARADLRIDGAADLGLANAFLTGAALRGPVRFDLGLNGAPGLAALSGRIELQGTRAVVSQPPLSFSNLSGTVTLGGGQAQLQLGAALDTGGALRVSGPVGLAAPFPGQLSVELDNLRLTDPQLYTTRVNGRLGVSGPLAGGAMISGAIRLAETELRIPSTGLGGSFAIPDLRHVGEPAAVRRTRARAGLLDGTGRGTTGTARPYGLDVAIDAPNRIFIRGRGLDAELGGSVLIQGTTANVVPSGGFSLIRGRLDLLGRRFNLDEGRLALEGALIPQVLLSATTEAEGVQASIVIEGPADAPEIRFVSAPELPEEEVVARLLFGRGLTSLTPLQAAQLASAVATLTGRGGAGVVDRVRRSFGLDDLDITGGENGGAAVRAGRYLSRNVYADVTVDSEGRSDISLNLDVGRNFTVRGRASSDGSTGLGVYFERDY